MGSNSIETGNKLVWPNNNAFRWNGEIEPNPCVWRFGPGPEGQKCKSCIYLYYWQRGKRYYKCCTKRRETRGPTSDHGINWNACAEYGKAAVVTPNELQDIKERCEKATKGPWKWGNDWTAVEKGALLLRKGGQRYWDYPKYGDLALWGNKNKSIINLRIDHYDPEWNTNEYLREGAPLPQDRDFIAHARTDIPRLLEEVERLKKQIKELHSAEEKQNGGIK